MTERALPDAAERHRAATDFEHNLVVLAGAGTGKTSLLVERVLNAIGSGIATMPEIGAITFTDKAAGEMRERLALGLDGLRSLAQGEKDPDPRDESGRAYEFLRKQTEFSAERLARRSLRAMEQLDVGSVTTIHGFCAELLRSFPIQAGVDPGFVVDNGEHADLLLDSTWRSFVDRELGSAAARPDLWCRLLSKIPLQIVAKVARASAGFNVPAELLEPPCPDLAALDALRLPAAALAAEIEALLAAQIGLSAAPLDYLESASQLLLTFEQEGLKAFRDAIQSKPKFREKIESRKSAGANKKLDASLQETAKRLLKATPDLLFKLWTIDDEPARSLLEAAAPFVLEYREQYLRQGFVSFDGLLSLARDLLRDHTTVREELKKRYRLLLVDEFQDTDPLQYEIVLFLAETPGEAAAEPFEARLEAGRLFVVGDAKQSIYRFRGADYSAYRRAVDRIKECAGAELNLVANFRSVPDVTEPINRLFETEGGCWEASPYQADYSPIEAARERAGGAPRVELWTVQSPDGVMKAEPGREAEGRLIAQAIERWVSEGSARYQDFTLLFRSFTSLSFYVRPLRELGIPFVVSGGREFLERPEVTQLMAIYRTLCRRADQPALLAFLRSPAGAVPDTELAAFARERLVWDWRTDVDADRFPGIARCFILLRGLAQEVDRLPVDTAVRRILERSLLLPLGAVAFEGAQRVANLRKLTSAAGVLARDGRLSLAEVVAALEAGNLEQVKTDQPLADDAAEAVRISTMHGMKGLENRRIILPDLAREENNRSSGSPVVLTRLPDGRPALGVQVAGTSNSPRVWHDMEDRLHGVAEEVRVFYVALTRAREHLILLARKGRRRAPWIEALSTWGFDLDAPPEDGATIGGGQVRHRLLAPPAREQRRKMQELPANPRAVEDYLAAVDALETRISPPFVAPSAAGEERDLAGDLATLTRSGHAFGKTVGRVLHRLLEVWDGGGRASFDRVLKRLASEEAATARHDAKSVEALAQEIATGFFDSELVRRFETVQRLGREISLLMRAPEGSLYRGSIDLIYEDQDGSVVVADYKTDDETREDQLRERYSEQLRIYAEATQQALDLARMPRRELWMLRSGQRIVLS